MTERVTVACEPVREPDVQALLEQAWAYSKALYPAESNHHLDGSGLDRPDVAFFAARRSGIALGCGALIGAGEGAAELKSLFVDPDARGLKVGRCLLEAIESYARSLGVAWLRLETGIRQPEALGLYASAGYRRIGPFGSYGHDPLSVFMEKTL